MAGERGLCRIVSDLQKDRILLGGDCGEKKRKDLAKLLEDYAEVTIMTMVRKETVVCRTNVNKQSTVNNLTVQSFMSFAAAQNTIWYARWSATHRITQVQNSDLLAEKSRKIINT